MKLQDQICTLEQAKRLKELGVAQQSLLYWVTRSVAAGGHVTHTTFVTDRPNLNKRKSLSAFTVAELGVLLPYGYFSLIDEMTNGNRVFSTWSYDGSAEPEAVIVKKMPTTETEAEIRAALLIHFLETGKVTPEEVNARLNQ